MDFYEFLRNVRLINEVTNVQKIFRIIIIDTQHFKHVSLWSVIFQHGVHGTIKSTRPIGSRFGVNLPRVYRYSLNKNKFHTFPFFCLFKPLNVKEKWRGSTIELHRVVVLLIIDFLLSS